MTDTEQVRTAKTTSLVIALFSFAIAPLLQYAPEGLWQVIRIFTGFYNIPVIALVVAGLFLPRVPAYAAKTVIIFHVIAYALLRFVVSWEINFVHTYALLFAIEMAIMLACTWQARRQLPRPQPHATNQTTTVHRTPRTTLDLTPWRYAKPVASLLVGFILVTYLLFSPLGLVDGIGTGFWWLLALVLMATAMAWYWTLPAAPTDPTSTDPV